MIDNHVYGTRDAQQIVTHSDAEPKATISWGAVFAGTLVSLALSILFTFLIAGLGFGRVDLQAHNPFSGLGTVFNVSSALSLAISLAAGSYVAGRLAGKSGMIHGFLNWALMTLLTAIISVMAITATARLASSAITSTISAAGSTIDNATDMLMKSGGAMDLDKFFGQNNTIQTAIDKAKQDIAHSLNNTQIQALHMDNLDHVVDKAKNDISQAISQFKEQPTQYQTIIATLLQKLKVQSDLLTQNINRNAVVQELVQRGWNQSDAQMAADKAINSYMDVKNTIATQINNAQNFVHNMPQKFEDLKLTAEQKIDNAAGTMQKATLWTFFGGLLGAVISIFAGRLGQAMRQKESHESEIVQTRNHGFA